MHAGPAAIERLERRVCRELGALHGKPQTVPGHRIDEPGGVAGLQEPLDGVRTHVNRQRAKHDRRCDEPGAREALAQHPIARQLAKQQFAGIAEHGGVVRPGRGFPRARLPRRHQAHVDEPVGKRRNADVPAAPHVHLAERHDAVHAFEIRADRPSPRAVGMPRQPQPERERGMASVCGDDDARRNRAVGIDDHSGDPLPVDHGASNSGGWLELGAGGRCLLQQRPVQLAASERSPLHAIGIGALDGNAVRARHDHAVDRQATCFETLGETGAGAEARACLD